MNENSPNNSEHFSTFIPCMITYNTGCVQFKCNFCIEITKEICKFQIIPEEKYSSPFEFEYKKYEALLVASDEVIFINDKTGVSSSIYFFQSMNDSGGVNGNLQRFVFIMANGGMLSYNPSDKLTNSFKNYTVFRIIHDHSFIPNGSIRHNNSSMSKNVIFICLSHIKSINKKEIIPFNLKYIGLVMPSIQYYEKFKISKIIESKRAKYESNFNFLGQFRIIMKIINNFDDDSEMYSAFKYSLDSQNNIFKQLEADCKELNQIIKNKNLNELPFYLSQIDIKNWNENLSNICLNVCKIYILSDTSKYYKNNFLIAMRIALFLKNSENIKNIAEFCDKGDDQNEIEEFRSKIDSLVKGKTDDEFEQMVYSIYKSLLRGFTPELSRRLGYDLGMELFDHFSPSTKSFFVLRQIKSFGWMEKDVFSFFINFLKCPWMIWFFIMKTKKPEKAYKSIIIAMVYYFVPLIVNENIEFEEMILDFWPKFREKAQNNNQVVKNVISLATYIYEGSAEQSCF